MLSIRYGNAGWVRVDAEAQPGPIYMRLEPDGKRWIVREIYIEAEDGGALDFEKLERIKWPALAAFVTHDPRHEASLRNHLELPGPELSLLASYFGTRFNADYADHLAKNWVAVSHLAQDPDTGFERPEPVKHRSFGVREPALDYPAPITDRFLRQVVANYRYYVAFGKSPAPAIAGRAGVGVATARKWIYTARQRGIMPPGQQGKVG